MRPDVGRLWYRYYIGEDFRADLRKAKISAGYQPRTENRLFTMYDYDAKKVDALRDDKNWPLFLNSEQFKLYRETGVPIKPVVVKETVEPAKVIETPVVEDKEPEVVIEAAPVEVFDVAQDETRVVKEVTKPVAKKRRGRPAKKKVAKTEE
ncbi:hypothetical protein N9137_01020 [Pseudomonadales bacterium]|nr:hypothetical protein [Pseudomonadales bacterium]